jgi:hypothetical protein
LSTHKRLKDAQKHSSDEKLPREIFPNQPSSYKIVYVNVQNVCDADEKTLE